MLMVEITSANDTVQLRKTRTNFRINRDSWHACSCCGRGFIKGEYKIDWRLKVPFMKNHYGWSAMFWTRHCLACFALTARAWELSLPKMVKLAQS